jgi:hypothetical protein
MSGKLIPPGSGRWLPLCKEQILAWADAHHERTGKWPRVASGRIAGSLGEKWANVDMALRAGRRGLPGGSSLARLLAEERGARNHLALPRLSREQILAWADAHYQRTGCWPSHDGGLIEDTPGETWAAVDNALLQGHRGLPGGSSLPQLLDRERGVRNVQDVPALTPEQILAWADAHHARTGKWPSRTSGPIVDAPGETWLAAHTALQKGQRSLPGGSSLAQLLAEHRGVRNDKRLPKLTVERILTWADAHYRRRRRWPTRHSGPIEGSGGETWASVDAALRHEGRHLPGKSSLAQLLAQRRGKRNPKRLAKLTVAQILYWAEAHHQRTGQWPSRDSGLIEGGRGETWLAIDTALHKGRRSLPGGTTLAQLLARHCGDRLGGSTS